MASTHPLASLELWHETGGSFNCGEADDLARAVAATDLDAAACIIAGHVERDSEREGDDADHLHVAAGGVIDSEERMTRARAHVLALITGGDSSPWSVNVWGSAERGGWRYTVKGPTVMTLVSSGPHDTKEDAEALAAADVARYAARTR